MAFVSCVCSPPARPERFMIEHLLLYNTILVSTSLALIAKAPRRTMLSQTKIRKE